MAAEGYPFNVRKGDEITGLNDLPINSHIKVFHAGTTTEDSKIKTNGGRVLCVCALADTLSQAKDRAYQTVQKIHWDGAFYRKDIGFKALKETSDA